MVVILVGGWLRFSDLGADPPIPLLDRTWGEGPSGCYLSDEGWYNSNALRWILGYEPTFPPEQINAARLTPLFYHLQTGIFWALDPSLSVARLIAAFSGFLLLFIFPLMETNPRRRLLLLVLVALDFVLITHSRLALPDMLGILCVILAGHAAMRDRPHLAAGAIIAAFAAKPIYMPAAILGAAASIGRTVRLPFFLSTCFMGAIFLVAVYVPGWNEIVSLTERLAPKRTLHPAGVLDYLWDGVWFYHWGPLIPLALLGLFDKERDRYYRWAVGTLAGAFIVLVSQRYQPLRYHLTLVLPAYLLAIRVTRG